VVTGEATEVVYTLSSLPPIGSFLGVEPVTLLVGLEDEPDGTLRVYLGHRAKGIYMQVITPQAQEHFRRAWGGGFGYVWMWPLPPADALFRDDKQAVQ
jgi:hypothetical protein